MRSELGQVSTQPSRITHVQEQLETISDKISRLSDSIASIEGRLSTILAPEEKKDTGGKAPEPNRVPLARELMEFAIKIDQARIKLDEIYTRIEL